MAPNFNREDGVVSEVQQARRLEFPPFATHPSQPTGRHRTSGARPAPRAQSRRILFIEDDRLIAEMYRMRLEADGWRVDLAVDGESGLRQAIADPPDLVLLDLLLPRLDGIEVLRTMRADQSTRNVPVLIVSNAVGLGGREEEARALGIVDWVVKANITPAGLASRVARILAD